MNSHNEKDPLWDLLGKASEEKPDAFFSRNVMREVRMLPEKQAWWKNLGFPQVAIASTAALAIAALTILSTPEQHSQPAFVDHQDEIEAIEVFQEIEIQASETELDYSDILNPISIVAHLDTSEYDELNELLEL